MTALRELVALDSIRTSQAVPVRSRRSVVLSDNARLIVFYQLAGNPYSVIGVAYGRPGQRPDHVVSCPDPLDRDAVAARLVPLRDGLLDWFASHRVRAVPSPTGHGYEAAAMPQLVVTGVGAVEALDDLAYMWRYTPSLGPDWERLGREVWALTDLRPWAAQGAVVPLAQALSEHYDFGISAPEAAKLSVGVAFCDAMSTPAGLSPAQLALAEEHEAGPLGRPDDLDAPVWEAALARRGEAPAVVRRTLLETWEYCNRAWGHLRAIPVSAAATAEADRLRTTWAWRVGADRTGVGQVRRRALPALASAAGTLDQLEAAQERFQAAYALEDLMVAAEAAGEGKGARVDASVTVTRANRRTTITLDCRTDQPLVPPEGALVGVAGTSVKARVLAVTGGPGAWQLTLGVGSDYEGSSGIRTAEHLRNGHYWFVVVPEGGPGPLPPPVVAPPTHPRALGGAGQP
jgi:hypothetical protein